MRVREDPPLARNYGVTLAGAIAALVPFIVFTSAFPFFRQQLISELHCAPATVDVINSLSTFGYAFGALAGGDLIQRFAQRRLFLICEALFVAGALLAASANGIIPFGIGYIAQGLATGLLLVVALPPVIQQFPAAKLPLTAAAIDIAFFGGVTLGPIVGGATAALAAWRWLFAVLAAFALAVMAVAMLTLPSKEPPNPRIRFDATGIALGFCATVFPFFAVGILSSSGFGSPVFLVPLIGGLACFAALLLVEYYEKEPLSPVKPMWNTMPVVGVIVAMVGGGAYFTVFVLAQQFLALVQHRSPLTVGLLFWPQIAGAMTAAALLGIVLRTRWLPLYALGGMLCLLAGGALILDMTATGSTSRFAAAVALIGLGAGASVAPGLWFASLSVQSKMVGRIFALVELVRSEANFLFAPIMLGVAVALSGGGMSLTAPALHTALAITLAVTFVLMLAGIALYIGGGFGLQRPDLERWLGSDEPAWASPELLAPLRGRHPGQQAARP